MKERPILFSAPMVQAVLNGSKTQTRRVIKPQPIGQEASIRQAIEGEFFGFKCPYGQVGDQLWVRETWVYKGQMWSTEKPEIREHYILYCADNKRETIVLSNDINPAPKQRKPKNGEDKYSYRQYLESTFSVKRPSIFMPRQYSRIQLQITSIRVERLNDISEFDAVWEGYKGFGVNGENISAKTWYKELWESINGAGSWASNPWVWVVEFKRVMP